MSAGTFLMLTGGVLGAVGAIVAMKLHDRIRGRR